MRAQDRGCLCKRRYNTEAECLQAIKDVTSKKPWLTGIMRHYRCPWCKHWHLTKKENSPK